MPSNHSAVNTTSGQRVQKKPPKPEIALSFSKNVVADQWLYQERPLYKLAEDVGSMSRSVEQVVRRTLRERIEELKQKKVAC